MLPKIQTLEWEMGHCTDSPPIVIPGILRKGRKMMIAGSSKSGKSLLLMELCVAIAEGGKWLDIDIPQGKVMYINFEIAADSVTRRFGDIYHALKIIPKHRENIYIWNLRGYAKPLDEILTEIIDNSQDMDVVILDPIYKIITGDENSASDMGYFANQIDRICAETGAAVIYCHHHSKGSQKSKKAIDRASGSGVFARDPDAVVDIIEHGSLWKMTAALREFPEPETIYFEYVYPLHLRQKLKPDIQEGAKLKDIAQKLGVSEPTARARLKKQGYIIERGIVLCPSSGLCSPRREES